MRRIVWSALFLMLLSLPARAVVIYTDFGPGNSFNSSGVAGAVTSTIGEAFEFTAAATGLVSSVDFAANVLSGTPSYTVSIAADAANHPGAIIDSMTATGLTTTPSVVNALSTLHPLLIQSTKYWIEITAGDATLGNTFVNNQSVLGLHARSDNAG